LLSSELVFGGHTLGLACRRMWIDHADIVRSAAGRGVPRIERAL